MIIGVDEVGRGCWAGPLVAAAVLLKEPVEGLNDSKRLSKKRREELAEIIKNEALAYGLGWVWPETIDISGISTAVKTAMTEAVKELRSHYLATYNQPLLEVEIIIDGNYNFLDTEPTARTVIKADLTEPAVSAASILAKVVRDHYMYKLAELYPEYGFEKHVGYGTAVHMVALTQYGVSDVHRKSYKPIRKYMGLYEQLHSRT